MFKLQEIYLPHYWCDSVIITLLPYRYLSYQPNVIKGTLVWTKEALNGNGINEIA